MEVFCKNSKCRFVKCAFSHEKSRKDLKIIHLENQVAELECKFKEIVRANIETTKHLGDIAKKLKYMEHKTKKRQMLN